MHSSFYSAATEVARGVFNTSARTDRDEASALADQTDLIVVFLFIALGVSLTAEFFALGFGEEIGQILAASG